MEGVTTAVVAFIFVCMVFPSLVRSRPHFYSALAAIIVVILVQALIPMIAAPKFTVFVGALSALLQVGAILLLFLACGGLSARELADDMKRAYEVIRRGEQEKDVIIPITGQMPRSAAAAARRDDDEDGRIVYTIEDPPSAPPSSGA